MTQLQESNTRLVQEKTELLATIEKGERRHSRHIEDKMKLQEKLSNLSKQLEGTLNKHMTHLQKLFDEVSTEIKDFKVEYHTLESEMSVVEEPSRLQVSL
jgi:hypothetical protein